MKKTVEIKTEYITMTQFLKLEGLIDSGGDAKYFLKENSVFLNDMMCVERNKKIHAGDVVKIHTDLFFFES